MENGVGEFSPLYDIEIPVATKSGETLEFLVKTIRVRLLLIFLMWPIFDLLFSEWNWLEVFLTWFYATET